MTFNQSYPADARDSRPVTTTFGNIALGLAWYLIKFALPNVARRVALVLAILGTMMLPTLTLGSLVVSNFNQGWFLSSGPLSGGGGTGGGGNGQLPPENYSFGLTNGAIRTWITQTSVYSGPLVIGQPTTNLFTLSFDTSVGAISGGAASSDFRLDFTLDFGDNYTYTRSTPPGNEADVKLLYIGVTGNPSEMAPGIGILGRGDYSLRVHAVNTAASSFLLQIGSTPVPEPACLTLVGISSAFLVLCRRNHRRH